MLSGEALVLYHTHFISISGIELLTKLTPSQEFHLILNIIIIIVVVVVIVVVSFSFYRCNSHFLSRPIFENDYINISKLA